jgi:hypothetical protein
VAAEAPDTEKCGDMEWGAGRGARRDASWEMWTVMMVSHPHGVV